MNRRSPSVLALQLGSTLANGKYKIIELVGAGAMGQVYRAEHTALGRTVAIKVLLTDMNSDEDHAEARFLREAKAASKLQHPCSMQVLDFGSENGVFYIVMEFLDGKTLTHLVRKQAPLNTDRIACLMSQVLAALAAAHDEGVIHRDLKPENIVMLNLINDDGIEVESLKVCDFGIAKIQSKEGFETNSMDTLTQEGMVSGTPSYMSPEQCRGVHIDARADLYSCGVMLFEMATGRLPFRAGHPMGIMMQHITDPPPNPLEVYQNTHPELSRIILKCLMKDPEERYATARQLREELKNLIPEGDRQCLSMVPGSGMEIGTDSSPKKISHSSRAFEPTVECNSEEAQHCQSSKATRQSERPSDAGTVLETGDAPIFGIPRVDSRSSKKIPAPQKVKEQKRVALIVLFAIIALLLFAVGGVYWALEIRSPENYPGEISTILPHHVRAASNDSPTEGRENGTGVPSARDRRQEETHGDSIDDKGVEAPPLSIGQHATSPLDDHKEVAPSVIPEQKKWTKKKHTKKSDKANETVAVPTAEEAALSTESPLPPQTSTLQEEVTASPTLNEIVEEQTTCASAEPIKPAPSISPPPPKVAPPPKKPPKKTTVHKPTPSPALDASLSLKDVAVRGSLSTVPVKTGIKRLNNEWQACYRQAAKNADKDARVILQIKLTLDEDGRARSPSVSKSPLPLLSNCVSKTAMKIRSRTRPDTGTVQVAFKLVFTPKPPTR